MRQLGQDLQELLHPGGAVGSQGLVHLPAAHSKEILKAPQTELPRNASNGGSPCSHTNREGIYLFFWAFRTWNRAQEGFLITFRVTGCNCVLLGTVPYRESCRCLCLLSLFPWRVCVYLLIAVECDCFCFVTFFWLGDGQQGDDKPPGPRHHPICGAEVPGRASVIRGAIAAWFVSRGLLVTIQGHRPVLEDPPL